MIKSFFIIFFMSTSFAWAQDTAKSKKMIQIFQGKTQITDPLQLRDPFKSPFVKKKKLKSMAAGKKFDGTYSNIPKMGNVELTDITIVGVLVGPERRALATVKSKPNQTFVLKEGMTVGKEKSELKAILPGGVIFVEKFQNLYGQDEYLETVIPISK